MKSAFYLISLLIIPIGFIHRTPIASALFGYEKESTAKIVSDLQTTTDRGLSGIASILYRITNKSGFHVENNIIHKEDDAREKTERGKVLKSKVRAKDLYDIYREVQADYHTKAYRSNRWRVLNQKDGVEVAMLDHPSDPTCPYIRMKATIPVPVEDCWEFLRISNWDITMPKMDPFYDGVTTYGEYNHRRVHMIVCRKRMKRIFAFGKRDLTFLSVSDVPLPDGTWVSGSVSVQSESLPRQKGYVRAFQDSIAFYKPLKANSETAITIVCRIDLNDSSVDGSNGFVPMWLYVKTVGLTGVASVIRMRNALIEEREKRLAVLSSPTGWLPRLREFAKRSS